MANTKFLNGTRFIFALWVFVGHFYEMVGSRRFIEIPILSKIIGSPEYAVDGFIIITGFLMTYNYLLQQDNEPNNKKSTAIKFYLRRLFRLYPVYLLALTVAFFFVEYAYDARYYISYYFINSSNILLRESNLNNYVLHLSFLNGIFPDVLKRSILGPAWSLSLEVQFYLIFPLLAVYLFSQKNQKYIPVISTFLSIISIISLKISSSILKTNMFIEPSLLVFKLPLFFIGIVIALFLLDRINVNQFILVLLTIVPFQESTVNIIISFLVLFMFLDSYKMDIPETLSNLLIRTRDFLSNKLSEFGANISYSLYLIHYIPMPIIVKYILLNYGEQIGNKFAIVAISFLISLLFNILVSYIIYVTIEKNFTDIGKRMIRGKRDYKILSLKPKSIS